MGKTISITWSKCEVPALIEADKTQVKEALSSVSEDDSKLKEDEEKKCDEKEEDKSVQESSDVVDENLADKQSDAAAEKEFVDALFDDSTENILS